MPHRWTQKKPLSFRQRRAATVLALGWVSLGQAAKLVGVTHETTWVWAPAAPGPGRVEELKREFEAHTCYQRRAGLKLALTTLEELVHSSDTRVSLAAMEIVLRLNGRLP